MTASNLSAGKENEQLQKLVGPENKILSAASATLYTNNHLAGDPRWVYRNSGVLVFIKDIARKGFYLKFYCFENSEREWEQKVLPKLKYMRTDDREHIMETDSGSARVTFKTTTDGKKFGEAIIQLEKHRRMQLNKVRARQLGPPPPPPPPPPTTKGPSSTPPPALPPRRFPSSGFQKNRSSPPLPPDGASNAMHSDVRPSTPSDYHRMLNKGSDSFDLSELESYLQSTESNDQGDADSTQQESGEAKVRGILKIPNRLRQKFTSHAKKPNTLAVTTPSSSTVYHEELCEFGTISVILKAGDIAESKADVIVNSTNSQFAFQNGGVAQALSRKAGPGLQQECKPLAPLYVKNVVRTQGYHLNCTEVFHCCCPEEFNTLAVIEVLMKCLNMASDSKYRTMVMPVFGTGNLGYPLDEVLVTTVSTLSEFALTKSSSLRSVILMVYFKDAALVENVKKFVKLWRDNLVKGMDSADSTPAGAPSEVATNDGKRKQSTDGSAVKVMTILQKPTTPSKNPISSGFARLGTMLAANYIEFGAVGNVSVILKAGDISNVTADVIINSTGNSFDLQTGGVAKSLSEKAGPKLQLECTAKSPLRDGDVVKTASYKLSCKALLHCCCPSKYSAKVLQGVMLKCLQMATEKKYESMAMPVIGTGNLGYPAEDVVRVIMAALSEFVEGQTCSVKTLTLMVYYKDYETIKKLHAFAALRKSGGPKDLPSNWVEPWDKFQAIQIGEGWKEREELEAEFCATLQSGIKVRILQVYRIQNPTTYKQYELQKKGVMGAKLTPPVVERNLWHGTTQAAVVNISREFFDRGLAGKNATKYGKGCYFSSTTAYSHRYAVEAADGSQYMFRVRVITGNYCLGDECMSKPPLLPSSTIDRYDSVVNDMKNPAMFVVFKDTAAYPEYVVQYKVEP